MKVEGKPRPVDLVVKGNALVHASYVMERNEKMLLWFIIWAYQRERSSQLTLSCSDVGDFIGMNKDGVYTAVWNVARALRTRELLLHNPEDETVTACGFVNWVRYGARRSGEIDVQITDRVLPHIERFIEDMKIGFTKYEMGVIASLRSFYALRLYEICKSMNYGEHRKDGWELSVEELRKRLGVYVVDAKGKVVVDSYGEWFRFRQKVLDKAVCEVNEASDLKITYKLRKNGRDIVGVRFWAAANMAGAVVMETEGRDKDLMQRMSRLGVSASMMKKLVAECGEHDRGRVEYALKATELEIKTGKIKNPAAWFVAAFKEDRRNQGELFTPEQRAKEKALEQAEIAADLKKRSKTRVSTGPVGMRELLKSVVPMPTMEKTTTTEPVTVAQSSNPELDEVLRKMALARAKAQKSEAVAQ